MRATVIAQRYAKALFELCDDPTTLEEVHTQFTVIHALIRQNEMSFLKDPVLSLEKRHAILSKVFKGRIADLLYKFLLLVCAKGRLPVLEDMVGAFDGLYLEKHGRIKATVETAMAIDEGTRQKVRAALKQRYPQEIEAEWQVHEDILGGFRIFIDGLVFDNSFKSQLADFKKNVLAVHGHPEARRAEGSKGE